MEGLPVALVLASQEEVYNDNNVLFRLVRPTPDGFGVQSTDRLVNVVPHRRVYCFERKDEVDIFRQEILKRPLVIQPVLHFGRGLFRDCGMCYSDESWVVMINQTHPKILSRLQMGFDYAKAGIERGQSVEIKFCFSDLIDRVYKEHLAQKELGEAQTTCDEFLTYTRYAEWEYGDLVIRYHGYAAKLGRTAHLRELKTMALNWTFDDVGMHEMLWSQVGDQTSCAPHLSPVTEDEIRAVLPAWTINSVSPLESIGDEIPQHTYSYAQAGRLYESFRKKKRQRDQHRAEADDSRPSHGQSPPPSKPLEELGAVGGKPQAVEHDFSHYNAGEKLPSNSRRRYQDDRKEYDDYANTERNFQNGDHYGQYPHGASPPQNSMLPTDRYGHLNANVHIVNPSRSPVSPSGSSMSPTAAPHMPQHYNGHQPANSDQYGQPTTFQGHLKKQDSDRSSRSTNADSGYCPDGDSQRSRGGSYDLNEYPHKAKNDMSGNYFGGDKTPLGDISGSPSGLENAGFRLDDDDRTDVAMHKHKEMVQKMLHGQSESPYGQEQPTYKSQGQLPSPNRLQHDMVYSDRPDVKMQAPPRHSRPAQAARLSEQVAESFI